MAGGGAEEDDPAEKARAWLRADPPPLDLPPSPQRLVRENSPAPVDLQTQH